MKVSLKISYILLTVFILLVLLSTNVKAANEGTQIIKSEEDYVIYVDDYESTSFSFAFSNAAETDISELKFYKNWTDADGKNVACLDNQLGIDLTSKIFMWINDESNNPIITAGEIDLTQAIDVKDIENLNSLTSRIMTDPSQIDSKTEDVGGVMITRTAGKLVITDSADYTYRYSLEKITESSNFSELTALLNQINNVSSETMIEKLDTIQKTDDKLDEMLANANWENVTDMTINQPDDCVTGDKFGVLLQKLDNNGEVVESDIQVLECDKIATQDKVTETVPVKVTSALPVTGEDITLYVTLAAIIIAIIAVIVRIIFLKKNKNNEKK